ncbi:hypothetical protein QBC43DRAFT_347438 [Cladorrhinum sp. PSN259]|nr:hypothetical protein QBC43DRAFT_347438 [Cladorrhinum sp. PSN259]
MKEFRIVFLSLLSLLLLPITALPANNDIVASPKPPKAPDLTFLYTLNITGGTVISIGQTPRGNRIVAPIAGGSFAGPKLKGTVVPVGGDWALFDANGTLTADVRQTLRTDDGAYIQVFETGTTQTDGSAYVRLTFETGSGKYYWLNYAIGIGIIRLVGDNQLRIDAWHMTPP